MSAEKKSLLALVGLILVTTAALAAVGPPAANHPVAVAVEVVQDKVLQGGDGKVAAALSLTAAALPMLGDPPQQATDLVIVLDRSGSMEGRKLSDARQAVLRLLDRLAPDDRLALVSYANGVQTHLALLPMNPSNRYQAAAAVEALSAGGGTNLGAGLEQGIQLLLHAPAGHRQRRIILISDGLANQGVTDPEALGRMASAAVENRFSISTVGVGLDFNEVLMTAIADRGAGHYHFLEDPGVFARVFETELQATRQVAAADVAVRLTLSPGVRLVDAGGYPIAVDGGEATIHPGDLLSGQERTIFLTFQVATETPRQIALGRVQVQYRQRDDIFSLAAPEPLTVACVTDPTAVTASIKKDAWADQVVQEEFSRLKEEVAADIRDGDKDRARARIQDYAQRQETLNAVVGSQKVAENLSTDVAGLRQQVDETFAGPPAAVAEKKKQAAKSLQYEGYRMRRDKSP
ncbi:MAG: VWA domain-containing protein [Desulfobacteraceae bacterium]|jgi:Ca-activated chloride channel family protein|nr:VWA domain-containing protein [Desulfobacteraceae bacterium]